MLREIKVSSESVAAALERRPDSRGRRFARFTLSLRARAVVERFFRARLKVRRVFHPKKSLFITEVISSLRWPNKAPEPTSTSVTPRATVLKMKCSIRIARSKAARVVPAVLVAHL